MFGCGVLFCLVLCVCCFDCFVLCWCVCVVFGLRLFDLCCFVVYCICCGLRCVLFVVVLLVCVCRGCDL